MAVYHLKVSVGSRAGGQSALAKREYIEREGRYAPDREEREHRESGNMPEWAESDPRSYWAAGDEYERANGRLYREVQFALPKELNEAGRPGTGLRVREAADRRGAAALHAGDPPGRSGRGEPPRAPDVLGAGQRWDQTPRRAVVQALQPEGTGAGGSAKIEGGVGSGLDGADPRGVGERSE